jgi:hypothetical protein
VHKEVYENADITYRTKTSEITLSNVRLVSGDKEIHAAWKDGHVYKGKRIWKKNVIEIIEKEGNAIE